MYSRRASALLGVLCLCAVSNAQFRQHNLVSDGAVAADHTDAQLKNPWGMALNPNPANGFMWVSDNGTGVTTLYDGAGNKNALVVSMPGSGAITGQVFNGGSSFVISDGTNSDTSRFIFASQDGRINAWAPGVDLTNARTQVDFSGSGASYTGIGLGTSTTGDRLFAANFARGTVDMFGGSFNYLGSITDSTVDEGYSPFNAQVFGNEVYVTYAQVGEEGDEEAGAGKGFVDVFSTDGVLLRRLVSHGDLNAPWGLAVAPDDFGEFGGALLVGNFGDGQIHAYDRTTGDLLGSLTDEEGNPIVIDGLWGLQFGNGGITGNLNTLFFAAGPNDEVNGLFGRLDPVPEPTTLFALGAGMAGLLLRRRRK